MYKSLFFSALCLFSSLSILSMKLDLQKPKSKEFMQRIGQCSKVQQKIEFYVSPEKEYDCQALAKELTDLYDPQTKMYTFRYDNDIIFLHPSIANRILNYYYPKN